MFHAGLMVNGRTSGAPPARAPRNLLRTRGLRQAPRNDQGRVIDPITRRFRSRTYDRVRATRRHGARDRIDHATLSVPH